MYRRFISTIAAASIALTTLGALPAFADDRDTARALAAILGLAIVGKVIHDNKKKRASHHAAPRYNPPVYDVQPRPLPKRANRKLLPRKCFRTFENRRSKIRMFGNRCLQNNYAHAHRLPQHCFNRFRTYDGWRRGYEARCLRDAGYRLARG